jgi:hypothetical protein
MSVHEDLQSTRKPGQADLIVASAFGQLLDAAVGEVHGYCSSAG